MYRFKETIVTVVSEEEQFFDVVWNAILEARRELEQYIARDEFFRLTMEPYGIKEAVRSSAMSGLPTAVTRMLSASVKAGVGPMAAVAGTLSWIGAEAAVNDGAKHIIVDNGGDIAMKVDRPTVVGIYAGGSPIRDLAFRIQPRKNIVGVCTSSGTVGPSISLGFADAAVVISEDVSIADACATALGNEVHDCSKKNVEGAFRAVERVAGIEGAMIICDEYIGTWGSLPEIVQAKMDYEKITRA